MKIPAAILFVALVFLMTYLVSAQGCGEPTGQPAPPIVFSETGNSYADTENLNSQIINYLNITRSTDGLQEALALPAAYRYAQVIESDITNDGHEDVLTKTTISYGGTFSEYIGLYSCTGDGYMVLDSQTGGGWNQEMNESPSNIIYVIDQNNNQKPEIVMRVDTIEGQKYHEMLKMLEWDGAKLAVIFSIGPYYGAFSDVRLLNLDDNPATLELIVGYYYAYEEETAQAFIELTHVRPISMVYQWYGDTLALKCRYFTDAPTTLFETLHSAEAYRACGFRDEAKRLYEKLWSDDTLTAWTQSDLGALPWLIYPEGEDQSAYADQLEKAYLRAFAGFRLVQFDLIAGNLESAEYTLKTLSGEYPPGTHGHIYAAMASEYWEGYQRYDRDAACSGLGIVFDNADDPKIDYYEDELRDGAVVHYGFYYANGHRYSSDPDNIFDVPDDIDGMVKIPYCA